MRVRLGRPGQQSTEAAVGCRYDSARRHVHTADGDGLYTGKYLVSITPPAQDGPMGAGPPPVRSSWAVLSGAAVALLGRFTEPKILHQRQPDDVGAPVPNGRIDALQNATLSATAPL